MEILGMDILSMDYVIYSTCLNIMFFTAMGMIVFRRVNNYAKNLFNNEVKLSIPENPVTKKKNPNQTNRRQLELNDITMLKVQITLMALLTLFVILISRELFDTQLRLMVSGGICSVFTIYAFSHVGKIKELSNENSGCF